MPKPSQQAVVRQGADPSSSKATSNSDPLSFAEMWEVAHAPPKRPLRLIVAAVVGLAVALAVGMVWQALRSVGMPHYPQASLDGFVPPATEGPEAWAADALLARTEPGIWEAAVSLAPPAAAAAPRRATNKRRDAKSRRPTTLAATPQVDPTYERIFGSSSRLAAVSARPSARPGAVDKQRGEAGVQGRVLQARLQDQVASDPAGSPVIALLVRSYHLGKIALPSGTEIHGTVVAGNEARIFVDFTFARLRDDSMVRLVGSARDERGRHGLAGKKLFTHKSAGSIGISSATRALKAAGREFAGTVGAVLGAGIEGAAESGADKAERADQDEFVVVTTPGARLGIYIQAVGEMEE